MAPVPAPTLPSSTGPAVAAAAARRPWAAPGRTTDEPCPRSNRDMPTTIGTTPALVGSPTPRSSRSRMTPSAAARPKADPPERTTASIRSIIRIGSSRSKSRVAGAPPLTSPEATVPSGNRTTVQPVRASRSVQWPTVTPSISVSTRPTVPPARGPHRAGGPQWARRNETSTRSGPRRPSGPCRGRQRPRRDAAGSSPRGTGRRRGTRQERAPDS